MLKQRVVTALILGAMVLLAIFLLPAMLWGVFVAVLVAVAAYEWCQLQGLDRGRTGGFVLAVVALALFLGTAPWLSSGTAARLAIYLCSVCFWAIVVPLWLWFKPDLSRSLLPYAVGLILFVPTSLALLELRQAHPVLLVLAILGVCVADIGAFFVGRAYGRRKLAPEISPGKSWEGFFGGVLGVVLFFLLVSAFWIPELSARMSYFGVACFALVFALASVEGDLFESLVKRKAGVKDSGSLLPGHGGVLDRVDSMLSTLPLAGVLLASWQYF
ncbi:MAG: phosphatidate cytidylyltransferase [Uliginosibacterium sp.]|nr:phosphatidate cytidylyltransferase [Uliginosibacterium sp.]